MAFETSEWPPEDERDLALGRFMHAWSCVEVALHELLLHLSGTSDAAAHAIANAIPDVGRMSELLSALGSLSLSTDDQKELRDIRKYLLVQGRYRNSIVHGFWGLRVNRDKRSIKGIIHAKEWVRVYHVIDSGEMGRSVLGKDEKGSERYVFGVPRLEERAKKSLEFADRIHRFAHGVYRKTKDQEAKTSS